MEMEKKASAIWKQIFQIQIESWNEILTPCEK